MCPFGDLGDLIPNFSVKRMNCGRKSGFCQLNGIFLHILEKEVGKYHKNKELSWNRTLKQAVTKFMEEDIGKL